MATPQQVFTAHAQQQPYSEILAPASQRRCAYVIGAASPLGEAVLNQLLAHSAYQQVYVAAKAQLPTTTAQLSSFMLNDPLPMPSNLAAADVFFVVGDTTTTDNKGLAKFGAQQRHLAYAELLPTTVVSVLAQCATALTKPADMVNGSAAIKQNYVIIAPHLAATQLQAWVGVATHNACCMSYGGGEAARSTQAYRFIPAGSSALDRLGVWVLNTVTQLAFDMMNPQKNAPLTLVKTAQRLVQQFERWQAGGAKHSNHLALTPEDLKTL